MAAPLKSDPHSWERDLEIASRRISADTAPEFNLFDETVLEVAAFEVPE
jgi:hypothetical protein